MSMILGLTSVSDSNIRRMLEDPPLVWQVVAPDDPDAYSEARSTRGRGGLFRRLLGRSQALPEDLALGPGEGADADLDKAWHGLHYLLTGTAWDGEAPLNFLLCGGQQIGDIDVGYGPARSFFAAEAAEILQPIASLEDTQLRDRFNPDEMTALEIYPEIWTRGSSEDDTLGYLMEYFTVLKQHLEKVVDCSHGFVVSIT